MKNRLQISRARIFVAFCSLVLVALTQTTASYANTTIQGDNQGWDSIQQSTNVDQSCIVQIRPQAPTATEAELANFCTVTTIVKSKVDVTNPNVVGIRTLALPEVRSKTWEINKIGITYFEVAKGKFYFDGSKAWSTKLYRGYKGYFDCQAPGSWGVTVQVTVEDCSSTYISDGSAVVDRETYKVSALFAGFPVYWVYAMSQLSKSDGTTTSRDF